ncbi:hypothetical protein ALC53_03280 [Atta colombica]|uniref:Uncharacterized protein n=1 Tax=Atta colombica TaxID=520822 RepID=A0A195BPS8_9HYME|nr:hypothetical protein ALC53_03280 [Atta colombica]
MGWGLTRTPCLYNSSYDASMQEQKSAPSKQVLPACPPIITTAMKSTCGARRMLLFTIILIFLMAALYWIFLYQSSHGVHRPVRIQPQASRNITPEQTGIAETTQR